MWMKEMHGKTVAKFQAFEMRHFGSSSPVGLKKFVKDPE
jgi:hypothetical protein